MNDFEYLLACSLHDRKTEHMEEMDLNAMKMQAVFVSVISTIACALKEKGNIRRNMIFQKEQEKPYGFLVQSKIMHMLLKEIVIVVLYPGYGMHEMADNDILIEADCSEEARRSMIGAGHGCVPFRKSDHDICLIKPFLGFVLHTLPYGRHLNGNDFHVIVIIHILSQDMDNDLQIKHIAEGLFEDPGNMIQLTED